MPDTQVSRAGNDEHESGFVQLQGKGGGPIEGMEALDESHENLCESERQMKEEELSFYSASENEHGDDNIWGLLSGVGGNIFEWWATLRLLVYRYICQNEQKTTRMMPSLWIVDSENCHGNNSM